MASVTVPAVAEAQPQYKNQRIMPRFPCQLHVVLANAPRKQPGTTYDISPGGMSIDVWHPVKVGSTVIGELSTPKGKIQFSGIVKWARQSNAERNQPGRIGVQFLGVDEAFFRLLKPQLGG